MVLAGWGTRKRRPRNTQPTAQPAGRLKIAKQPQISKQPPSRGQEAGVYMHSTRCRTAHEPGILAGDDSRAVKGATQSRAFHESADSAALATHTKSRLTETPVLHSQPWCHACGVFCPAEQVQGMQHKGRLCTDPYCYPDCAAAVQHKQERGQRWCAKQQRTCYLCDLK